MTRLNAATLRRLRVERGWSRDDVVVEARRLRRRIASDQIAKLENGRSKGLSVDKARTLALVFGVPIEDLLVDEPATAVA